MFDSKAVPFEEVIIALEKSSRFSFAFSFCRCPPFQTNLWMWVDL